MDALKNILENLKEKLKVAWAEQQESALYIQLKERYEELPPIGQKGVVWGAIALLAVLVLWWPVSNLMDASDFNSQFEERRVELKELLKIERDTASEPVVPPAPAPEMLKTQFDQKIAASGVKPDQIKESGVEIPTKTVSGAEMHGILYRLERLTIRQALDLGYDLEHTDPSLKIDGLELVANAQDNHFYDVVFRLVNYAAEEPESLEGIPGKGIVDAIKKRGGGHGNAMSPKMGMPAGEAPAIPQIGIPHRGSRK